ncbi:thioredoxin family protein [Kitasatospora kazusensis]|uniref:Thioredoxin family protein n=1 Tax=Kitasatospora kazusensis TaxID=407974 RepID=A0ABN3A1S0_9ACTN
MAGRRTLRGRGTDGRLRVRAEDGAVRLSAAELGAGPGGSGSTGSGPGGADPGGAGRRLGARATLVQFSSAFCQPCRATRRVLAEVAAMVDGVAHVEVDAEERLDLVRRLEILKTPTVLVLDAAGRVVRRAVGQPRRVDVIAALGEAVHRNEQAARTGPGAGPDGDGQPS